MITNPSIVPVVLFAYARPDHLLLTLEGLRNNNIHKVYAFSDGPKYKDNIDGVNKVREILRSVDWCDIKIIERKQNLGLGVSVRTGIEEVFKEHDKLVVVEDDIVMHKGAYKFICDALRFYEQDQNIMSVSLWSHPLLVPKNINGSVFFCPRFNCWGWGAYRRSWEGMEKTALELLEECKQKKIPINKFGNDYEKMAKMELTRNIWAIRFAMLHLLLGKVNVWATEAWVENIGQDGSGTNSAKKLPKSYTTNFNSENNTDNNSTDINYTFLKYNGVNASSRLFKKYYDGNLFIRLKKLFGKIVRMLLLVETGKNAE